MSSLGGMHLISGITHYLFVYMFVSQPLIVYSDQGL